MTNIYPKILATETGSIQTLLPQLSSRLSWSRKEIEAEQLQRLISLLAYAKQHSPYYTKKLSSINPAQFKLSDLSKIPSINKKEVMAHWDELTTDQNVTFVKASEFLMHQTKPGLLNNMYHLTATGGSSGIRGLFGWEIDEFILFVTIFYRFQFRDGLTLTDNNKPLLIAAITAEKNVHLSRFVFTIPPIPQTKVLLLPATTSINEMITKLNKHQPTHLIGYTSEIYRLAQEACRGKLTISPQRVSVNSEPLFPEMLATIKKAWGVPVTNMWGSSDAGPHAQSCDFTDHLHLNEDFMIFEAVDEHNQPVAAGKEAAKVLITNLFHKSMPLFRYEIDDRITILKDPCKCGSKFRLVQSVYGRNDDNFQYENNVCIIPELFENLIFPEANINEYQIIQTTTGAEVYLTTSGFVDTQKMQSCLVRAYQQSGLKYPDIEVKIVSQLKRHPETGKLKRFIRL